MKKIILAASVSFMISLLPTFSNANPFLQLMRNVSALQAGVCGDPSKQPAADFCACFDAQMTQGCKDRGLPPPNCTNINWLKNQIRQVTVPITCHKYPPPGVSYDECVMDVNFFLENC